MVLLITESDVLVEEEKFQKFQQFNKYFDYNVFNIIESFLQYNILKIFYDLENL